MWEAHQEDLPPGRVQADNLHIAGLQRVLLLLQGGCCPLGQVGIVGQPGAREAIGGQVVQQVQGLVPAQCRRQQPRPPRQQRAAAMPLQNRTK